MSRARSEPLVLRIARGTSVLEEHEAAVVDACTQNAGSDKEAEDCIVAFLADSDNLADLEANDGVMDKGSKVSVNDDDNVENLMPDVMQSLWGDELAETMSTISEEVEEPKESKPEKVARPWSSRSSPSGTFVRDPKTGKMNNIG